MIAAHADAVLGLLRADEWLTVYPVADGAAGDGRIVPAGAVPPYAVAHLYVEPTLGPNLVRASIRRRVRAIVHCVGADHAAARAVQQRVQDALLDVRPDVAGMTCWPIRCESVQAPRPDESTGSLIVDVVATYTYLSQPASSG